MSPAGGGGKILALWGPVALYGAGIAWLSHQPNLSPPLGLPDWPMHIAEYAGLAALTARALGRTRIGLGPAGVAAGLFALAVFAVTDEWHQSFVPGRHASATDVLSDVTGAALALVTGLIMTRYAARRRAASRIEITLFGRPGCHLCDEAEKVIKEVCARGSLGQGIDIRKVDVDTDAALARAYGDRVPVITINGRKHFKYRVDPERLRRVLESIGGTGRR